MNDSLIRVARDCSLIFFVVAIVDDDPFRALVDVIIVYGTEYRRRVIGM